MSTVSFKLSNFTQEPEIPSAPAFQISTQQQAVVDWVRQGRGNAIVTAVAGAGKTTCLLAAVEAMSGFVDIAAYNKAISVEISGKLAQRGVDKRRVHAGTFHSFGFKAWRRAFPDAKIEGFDDDQAGYLKFDRIADELKIPIEFRAFARSLSSLSKQYALSPASDGPWMNLVNHFDLEDLLVGEFDSDLSSDERLGIGVKFAQDSLRLSNRIAHEVIDYDDMVYAPVAMNARIWQNDWLLVDESQDVNPARRLLARRMLKPGGRSIWVGDPCQPTGTKVTLADGSQCPIELVRVGMMVRSFNRKDSSFLFKGRRVNGVTRRKYTGQLVTVSSVRDGVATETQYTANHYCYALLKPIGNHFSVYLMRKDNLWRVGTARVQYDGGVTGPMVRKRLEGADDVWLLKTFSRERDAKTYEFQISTEYGIPELLFNTSCGPNSEYLASSQAAIDASWESLDKDALDRRARRVLSDHGRHLDYPLNELASRPGEFWVTRPVRIRACNLMDGMAVLHYHGRAHYKRDDFAPIKVSHQNWSGDVYSMDIDVDHSYIGDGIATFNCQAIYGFSGADSDSLVNIRREFRCVDLPLTVTFRCPKSVVQVARTWVSHIEAHPTAPDGTVSAMTIQDFNKIVPDPTDAVLCRNTAPLLEMAYEFIKRGIPCHVEGRDIGRGLLALVNKWKIVHLSPFVERLLAYQAREVQRLMSRNQEMRADSLNDKVETILVIVKSLPVGSNVNDLRNKITDMFADTPDGKPAVNLTLCTIHRSKGREWNRVFWLGRNRYQPSAYARQDWQMVQERNLMYVCCTRAKSELVEVIA